MENRAATLPTLALITVAVLWGITFTVTAAALTSLPAAWVVVLRFGLAALLLAVITRRLPPLPPTLLLRALALGSLLGLGFLLQTWALSSTGAVASGFLTGSLVIIAPVLDTVIFRRRLPRVTWVAVTLALVGLVVVTVRRGDVGHGELLTVLAAAAWGLHLVLLSRWSVPAYAVGLARTQTLVVAVLGLVAVALAGPRSVPDPTAVPLPTWVLTAFLAVFSTALPIVALTWAQSRVDATRTAVLLTLEPVAAAVTAALAGATLDPRTVAGGTILVLAMILVARAPTRSPAEVR